MRTATAIIAGVISTMAHVPTAHAGPASATGATQPRAITAPGPEGDLAGTLIPAAKDQPIVLIIPGSGPTDRDGNNPLGVTAASYRLLAEGLAQRGIGTLRIDKRGMFGSAAAVADANDVTIADYAADIVTWIAAVRAETGAACLWLFGHSEGGLVALEAAQATKGVCGVILAASPGRSGGTILREQLAANPANAALLDQAISAIDALEAGERVPVDGMHPALQSLFNPAVQGFLIDIFARDPAAMIAHIEPPVLIIAGGKDLQTPIADAGALAQGQAQADIVVIEDMNHIFKRVEQDDRAANLATYADSSLPIHPDLIDVLARYLGQDRN
ncbi:MAG: alpha/beta fold hydrolase [Pseudomonadota bacterium]